MAKDFIGIDEVAVLTGYKRNYLYILSSRREIPHYKRGRRIIFERSEIEDWMMRTPVRQAEEIERAAMSYCVQKG